MSEEASKLYVQGCSAYGAGNYELAERKFTEAIALNPTNKNFRIDKGLSIQEQGRVDDALREYDRLLELFPDCGTAWTRKAMLLNRRKLFEEAKMCAENALRLNSKDGAAWGAKGLALELQRKTDEAMMCYDEQIRLSLAQGWANKGSLLACEYCDYENAILCFDKALNLDGRNRVAWNGKGASYYCLGLFEDAVKCYDKVLNAFPRYTSAWNNKGLALFCQGNFQEAEKCLQTASSLSPSYTNPINFLGYSNLHQGKFQEALKWFEKVLAIEKENTFASHGKALCEYLMTDPRPPICPELTRKSLQKLSKLNQTELYFCRGKTLQIFGELEDAKKSFEKCLELNPHYKAAAFEIDKIKQMRRKKGAVDLAAICTP